jgi:uncharacterized protein YrrD
MASNIKQTDPGREYRRVLSASTLAGDSVKNTEGDDLGKVDEIMIDIPSGRVGIRGAFVRRDFANGQQAVRRSLGSLDCR